ncbi:hypothetical protein AQUCO_01700315v1 [Aquilegia coerulea]|uniref:Kinesin motor domain-containing protein n=2 Tax=Aquilegia coerulea TaxID=218851 RepID=A0A2G5DM88_AQUCA|nr:hypothetical protein AQUCO_01700315v1 [Aquilegia coerulea]
MFLSEEEQISVPVEKVNETMEKLHPTMNMDSFDGLPLVSESPDSPPTPACYTDVNVIPEHEKKALEETVVNLEGELKGLKLKQRSLDEKRREALNKILDLKGSIRVFCRVRPYISTDRKRYRDPICIRSEKVVIRSSTIKKEFSFDTVFSQEASQDDVFMEVEPILRSALDGNNVCILAYGQTGTGKTFTMEGTNEQPGIVPRALEQIFCLAAQDNSVSYTFSMSMLEVYMGSLRDLLAPKPHHRLHETVSKCNLNIQSDLNGFVKVEGLTDVGLSDFTQASRWYTKGKRARSTAWTNVNESSSRSHCLARITIRRSGSMDGSKAEVCKLWMVDLGGSERCLKTGATGQTLDEGKAINLSLSALGDVIAALKRHRSHVPYRNSKLTQILKDSLGDGSKVLMLVHVSPCEEDVGETTCSLIFAKRVRAVESNKELSEDSKKHRDKRILELNQEMRDAEEDCQKVKNQIMKAEFLLHENRRLYTNTYVHLEDQETPSSPREDYKEVIETPRLAEKTIRRNSSNSLPRFMTSTAASRHRHSVIDGETNVRAIILKMGTRSSLQFSGSQSLSSSDPHFRAVLRNSNTRSRYGEPIKSSAEIPNCSDLDLRTPSCITKQKRVTASHPNVRVTQLSNHRRRMSDLV